MATGCQFHQHLRARFSYEILLPKPKRDQKSCQNVTFVQKMRAFNVDEIDSRKGCQKFSNAFTTLPQESTDRQDKRGLLLLPAPPLSKYLFIVFKATNIFLAPMEMFCPHVEKSLWTPIAHVNCVVFLYVLLCFQPRFISQHNYNDNLRQFNKWQCEKHVST